MKYKKNEEKKLKIKRMNLLRSVMLQRLQESIWSEQHRGFFKKGIDAPKFRVLKFHTIEEYFGLKGNLGHVNINKSIVGVKWRKCECRRIVE